MTSPRKASDGTPSLGTLDGLDLDRPRSPPPPPPPAPPPGEPPPTRGSRGWLYAVLALVLLAGLAGLALVHWRDSLSEALIPASEFNRDVEAAQLALARGELSRPDGQGARELFLAILARDPDHPTARSGLVAVREAALVRAREALAAGDFAQAHEMVALARAMAAPADALAGLEQALVQRESAEADIGERLQRARDAQAQGRIEQLPDGALALYGQVLERQPDNAIALEGRRILLSGLLRQAGEAMDQGDLRTATALVDRVASTDPSHLELPAVKARLGELQAAGDRDRGREFDAAEADLRAGRVDAAAAALRDLLAEAPDDPRARKGLDDAAAVLAARAMREAADFEFDAARELLARAREWSPGSPAVAEAERRLARAEAAEDVLPERTPDPDALGDLLDQARAAMRAGDLVDPPGASAWDLLRRASALAPDNPGVREVQAEYGRRARACFEDELAGNRLGAAQACLDAMAVQMRGGDDLGMERRRLADRWLAFGEERLGASEYALARRALRAAREIDPANPRLEAFAQRLRQAGG